MLNPATKNMVKIWPSVSPFVHVPHNEQEYEKLAALLNDLIDEVGEDESHPLASRMEVIGSLMEIYEEEHDRALSFDD